MSGADSLRLARLDGSAGFLARTLPAAVYAALMAEPVPAMPLIAPLAGYLLFEPDRRNREWLGHLPIDAHTQWLSRTATVILAVTLIAGAGCSASTSGGIHGALFASTGVMAVLFQRLLFRLAGTPARKSNTELACACIFAGAGVLAGMADPGEVAGWCAVFAPSLAITNAMMFRWTGRGFPFVYLETEEPGRATSRAETDWILFSLVLVSCFLVFYSGASAVQLIWALSILADFSRSVPLVPHLPRSPRRAFARRSALVLAAVGIPLLWNFQLREHSAWRERDLLERADLASDGKAEYRLHPFEIYVTTRHVRPWSAPISWDPRLCWWWLDHDPKAMQAARGKAALAGLLATAVIWALFSVFRHWAMAAWMVLLSFTASRGGGWGRLWFGMLKPANILPESWGLGESALFTAAVACVAYVIAQEAYVRRQIRSA